MEKLIMKFYTVDGVEELTCTCPEDAVIQWCENLLEGDELPAVVQVGEFETDCIDVEELDHNLWLIYESLDEEYGSPYDGPTEIPDSVKAKYKELVEEIVKTYQVCRCVPTWNTVIIPTKGLFSE